MAVYYTTETMAKVHLSRFHFYGNTTQFISLSLYIINSTDMYVLTSIHNNDIIEMRLLIEPSLKLKVR